MKKELDFTTLPIGTVVYDNTRQGRGIIKAIRIDNIYPVLVEFNKEKVGLYTSNGAYHDDAKPTLSTEDYVMPEMKCEIPKPPLKKGDLVVCNMGGGAKRIGVYQHTETNFAMEDVAHVLLDLSKPYSTCTFHPDEIEPYEK